MSIVYDVFQVCKTRDINYINSCISNSADWRNMWLYGACQSGYMDVVQFVISKGYNQWNDAIFQACKSGNLEIVQLLISKGADDWNSGLAGACSGGSRCMEIVQLMISKGANEWGRALSLACAGGCMDIVKLIISKGAKNWSYSLGNACKSGNMEIAKLMISKAHEAKEKQERFIDWFYAFESACQGAHLDMVKFILDQHAKDSKNLELGILKSLDIYEYNSEKSDDDDDFDRVPKFEWNYGLKCAIENNCMPLAHFLILKGANNIDKVCEWPWDLHKISKLLYLGTRLDVFSNIRGFKQLKSHVFKIQQSILGSSVMISDLLSLVSTFIVV